MIQDDLSDLTSSDQQARIRAAVAVGNFASKLRTLGVKEKSDFERLCRQAETYPEWPESEQHRFGRLVQSVLEAARKEGRLFDKDGTPIWP